MMDSRWRVRPAYEWLPMFIEAAFSFTRVPTHLKFLTRMSYSIYPDFQMQMPTILIVIIGQTLLPFSMIILAKAVKEVSPKCFFISALSDEYLCNACLHSCLICHF